MTDCRYLQQQNGNPANFPNHYQSKLPICSSSDSNSNSDNNNMYNKYIPKSLGAKKMLLQCAHHPQQQQQPPTNCPKDCRGASEKRQQQKQQQQEQQQQLCSPLALASPWLERTFAACLHSTRQHVRSYWLRRVTGLSESE